MKERSDVAVEEDTEEMRRRRSLNQSETNLCWKILAEREEEEVLDKYKVENTKKILLQGEVTPWNGEGYAKTLKIGKWREDCWARIFSFFREYNLQRLQSKQEELTEEEEMKQQQRMAIMNDLIKKVRSKGSMDAKNHRWLLELLAKDCDKAWTHTGWEDTMQKWYEAKEKWRRCINEKWRR